MYGISYKYTVGSRTISENSCHSGSTVESTSLTMDKELDEETFLKVAAKVDEATLVNGTKTFLSNYPHGSTEWKFKSFKLSSYFGSLFKKSGNLVFGDEAVRIAREALDATQANDPSRATQLGNLAAHLGQRYEKTREVADLDEGLGLLRLAIDLDPNESDRYAKLNNLAINRQKTYLRTKDPKHLREAVNISRAVCESVLVHDSKRPAYLKTLANGLDTLYAVSEDLEDLDGVIEAFWEALSLISSDDPKKAEYLHSLAVALGRRYSAKGIPKDIAEAITISEKAIQNLSPEDPGLATYHLGLGELLRSRYLVISEKSDLKQAILHFQLALDHTFSDIRERILAGRHLAACQVVIGNVQGAHKTSISATRLIPLLAPRSAGSSDTQFALSEFTRLATDAAAIALEANQDPVSAIQMLEAGRSVLLGSLADLRLDVTDLKEKHPMLAEQFLELRNQLDVSSKAGNPNETGSRNRREINKQLESLLAMIRQKPNFENFLLPTTIDEMYLATDRGPVVMVNISMHRCDALIIKSSKIQVVHLSLGLSEVEEMYTQLQINLPSVLEWLWDKIAKPVLEQLGLTKRPADDRWPHVWWILTGAISGFPIHAAGYHLRHSFETVIDRVLSSYAPSINAILRCRRMEPSRPMQPEKALLVAMQNTPGKTKLPYTVAEVEMLQKLCTSVNIEAFLPLQRKQDLLSHLSACQIFHFAGHGETSETNPLNSALLLRDDTSNRVTVQDILDLDLQADPPFLAFLSACGTGRIKEQKLLDETVHFLTACQLAGFRNVIGTLWEVNDKSCIDVTRLVYESINEEQWAHVSVARALHRAGRQLRDKWVIDAEVVGVDSAEKSSFASTQDMDRFTIIDRGSCANWSRNAGLVEDDEDAEFEASVGHGRKSGFPDSDPLSWVSYVHFGF